MRVLIATGIFPPEAGGPAQYAPHLASALAEKGDDVTVLTYSDKPRYDFDTGYSFKLVRLVRRGGFLGKVFNRVRFFFALLPLIHKSDCVYSLDWFAVGLPLTLATKILRKPYIVRVGGDYAWEQVYLQSGAPPVTLSTFYETGMHKEGKYGAVYRVVRFVLLRAAHVVFNSDVQRDMYQKHYGLLPERISTIYNPKPEMPPTVRQEGSREIVFWGRFIVMKNISSLIRAFASAKLPDSYHLTLIGDGPERTRLYELVRDLELNKKVSILHAMPWEAVLDRVKSARALVLPSWTDISPVQVYEALALGLPSLVTRENYLPIKEQLPEMIDPTSVEDIAKKIEMLADEKRYEEFAKKFNSIRFDNDWDAALKAHQDLFASVTGVARSGARVLQIGADRSKRGILYPDSPAAKRQKAYGEKFDRLDIIGFSLKSDERKSFEISPKTHVYPTNSLSKLMWGIDALRLARSLPRPTVVSAQDPFETGLIAALIAWAKGVPLHVQIHTDFLSPAYRGMSLLNAVRVMIARFVLRRASRVRAVSPRIKNGIEMHLGIKVPITILPIFADLEKFRNAKVSQELKEKYQHFDKKILIAARLESEKNISLAIRSIATLSQKNVCLIIAGNGSELGVLQALSESLHVSKHVFFEDPEDVAPYFALADLVLVTSRYEGYGLVVPEALASGKPVLSTDVGVAKEMGAIIATPDRFPEALGTWLKEGPEKMTLISYPYKNFEEYVQAYCADIAAA